MLLERIMYLPFFLKTLIFPVAYHDPTVWETLLLVSNCLAGEVLDIIRLHFIARWGKQLSELFALNNQGLYESTNIKRSRW